MSESYQLEATSKVVAFDFDGTVYGHESGWQGIAAIADPPVPGIKDLFKRLSASGYEIVICTYRATSYTAYKAITEWLARNGLLEYVRQVTATKPVARCYVGDRAINFNGDASKLFEQIDSFKSWTEVER